MLPCVIALVLAVSLGCAQEAGEWGAESVTTADGARAWMLASAAGIENTNDNGGDGETLTAQVEERLVAEGQIDDASVEVTATGGVVTLTGRVADETSKRQLAAAVAEVEGVEHVENRLRVSHAPEQPHRLPSRQ